MLQKIEKKEIMTSFEAHEKYSNKFFLMVITEVVDQGDNDLGYVIYIADDKLELSKAPLEEYKGMVVASMIGGAAEPYPSYGGLEVVHYA